MNVAAERDLFVYRDIDIAIAISGLLFRFGDAEDKTGQPAFATGTCSCFFQPYEALTRWRDGLGRTGSRL